MAIELTIERIKALSKSKGFKMKFICGNIGVRDNYFTDCKAKKIDIPVDKLTAVAIMLDTTVPLGAYPNPSSYGERYSFKPKDTPYHNGRECPFSILVSLVNNRGYFPISPL